MKIDSSKIAYIVDPIGFHGRFKAIVASIPAEQQQK